MCDALFPEVEDCCLVASVRVGLILIGVLAISTGAVTLGIMEQKRNVQFGNVLNIVNKYQNTSIYSQPKKVMTDLSELISTVCVLMSLVFMFAGLVLLFATLSDQEGFAQMFVILVFANVIIGVITLAAICFECVYVSNSKCLFGNMDWLSASCTVLAFLFYLILWYYFCCVANSYALNAYT